jgi:hypothetical protein
LLPLDLVLQLGLNKKRRYKKMELIQLFVVALVIEALWEAVRMIWDLGRFNVHKFGATILGIIIAIFANIDMFDSLRINFYIPIIGNVLTGIALSRGANFLNDLFTGIYALSKREG